MATSRPPSMPMRAAALVLAGGLGTRVGASGNKVYLPVAGRPLLAWSVQTFQDSPLIDRIVLVVRAEDAATARQAVTDHDWSKVGAVVPGGPTRHASEHAGLEAVAAAIEGGQVDVVCVHDAARPFATRSLIERVLTAARDHGGAVPCIEIAEPALLRATPAGDVAVVSTGNLRRVQTPQAFRATELLAAHRSASRSGFHGVDTAEPVQRFGDVAVRAVPGDPDNLKVTFADDLAVAETLATRRTPPEA